MGKRILFIEDDEFFAGILKSHLAKRDHIVYIAGDGKTGIKNAEQHAPNLIFLDVMLPGMDGYQVCSEIRNNANIQQCPIIMLTGEDKMRAVKTENERGANDYIFKAQPIDDVLARIDKMILDYAL